MDIGEAFITPLLRFFMVHILIGWLFTFMSRGKNEEARSEPLPAGGMDVPDSTAGELSDEEGVTMPDAKGLNPSSGAPSTPNRLTVKRKSIPGAIYSNLVPDCYDMSHKKRGQAIIIDNKTFVDSLEMGVRKGTEVDAANLESVFKDMGFTSSVHADCNAEMMMAIIAEAADQNHADEDCFVLVILTHGGEGIVYATDDEVKIDDLLTPLKTCPTLAGKPKIIIIQACRGERLDEGTDVVDAKGVEDEEEEATKPVVYRVPVEADFLIAYASVPGYYAWRNELQGSWFIQALVDVLRKYWTRMDFLTMMTRVCKSVALDFESTRTNRQKYLHKKQVPCINTMLTRDLYFDPPIKAEK